MSNKIRFTFLGTGTSQGIPLIGCACDVCQSVDLRDKRLRTALLIESETTTICIDAGPDFRYQMLRTGVKKLDAIVFTHEHNDHTAGLDEVRAFNFIQRKVMPLYAAPRVQERLKEQYSYIFKNPDYPGVPQIEFQVLENKPFTIGDIELTPIALMHGDMPVFGFKIGDFTYITDANHIDDVELEKFKGAKHLVLNALRREKHHAHFTLSEAMDLGKKQEVENLYLTHLSHQMGKHALISAALRKGVQLAHDGLIVEI